MSRAIAQRLERWQQGQFAHLAGFCAVTRYGRVLRINGLLLHCRLPQARIGDLCRVQAAGNTWILAEIIGCDQQDATLSALASLEGISAGAAVESLAAVHQVRVGNDLLGQVLDGFGRALVEGGASAFARAPCEGARAVVCDAPLATQRPRIARALPTGVRAIDGLLTLGEGQRAGLFAGAGCGKTTLLAEIARNVDCDVIVFGLIGERGRELREFLDHELDAGLRA